MIPAIITTIIKLKPVIHNNSIINLSSSTDEDSEKERMKKSTTFPQLPMKFSIQTLKRRIFQSTPAHKINSILLLVVVPLTTAVGEEKNFSTGKL